MTVGPTLHYSHKNVQRCWFLAIFAFVVSCLFWSKIVTGTFQIFTFSDISSTNFWNLGGSVISGVSIFEYPLQIIVLGLLMGILAIVPVLISQLMSFRYSLLFIFAVLFLAILPGLAISLLISCVAVACRPLRFRSRFISVALCTSPQLFYWGLFGGAIAVEPIKWGFSFTPWICAWIVGLGIASIVLGIGHFTRYRPGLVWIFTSTTLLLAVILFEIKIGFDELDYQLYVAKSNPELISDFYDHSVTEVLDKAVTNPSGKVKRYLDRSFHSTEPIQLRAELKAVIRNYLSKGSWPNWFTVSQKMDYPKNKQKLIEQYDLFIRLRSKSRRMPIALYYKALLSEFSPDIEMFEFKEILHFYSDYPFEMSQDIWFRLYSDYGESPESIEARWRIAHKWAVQERFTQADRLLTEAQGKLTERLEELEKSPSPTDTFFSSFRPPADSVMTFVKLNELQRRINQLRSLISEENLKHEESSGKRLANFIHLNPHTSDYAKHLDQLLEQMKGDAPLQDNVLLAKTKLIADKQLRAENFDKLHKRFKDTDGGMQALYELALLKISLWQNQDVSNLEQKNMYLTETRTTHSTFLNLYPDSIYTEQVKKNLEALPQVAD